MKHMQYSIAWSMGKARRNSLTNKEGAKLPGPGIYKETNQNIIKNQNPQWTIKGKGSGEKYTRDVPGPGQYDGDFKKHGAPFYSFGSKLSQTVRHDNSDQPGPGTYQSPNTLNKKGGYLGIKTHVKKKNEIPGPGQYSLNSTFTNRFGTGFGKGKRSSPNLNKSVQMPGPGTYEPTSDFGRKTHGAGFGTGKREDFKGDKNMPGPGAYKVSDQLFRDSKAASIKGRPQTTKVDLRPGPGHYQSKSMITSPAFTIAGKAKAQKMGYDDNPAPGGYNPDYTKVKQGIPGINFGSPSKAAKGDNSMPGPGQYELKTTVGSDAPSFGIRGRYNDPKGDIKPGPGNYNPKDDLIRQGTPGTVMGSSVRQPLMKGDGAPGPGNYDLDHSLEKGKHYSFGAGKRDDSANRGKDGMPGPGTYNPPGLVGHEGKGVILLGKAKDKAPDSNPGPGTYASDHQRNGPSYSISGHRTEDPMVKNKMQMPGPNIYNPDDSAVKSRPPTVSFGSKPKTSDLKGDGMPGPGQYQLKSTLSGQGIHIGTKSPEKVKEGAPGPGTYKTNPDVKFKTGPSFSISGGKGEAYNPNKGMPGPGTYDSPERPTTGYKFGSEARQGLGGKGDAPGPGQYSVPSKIGTEGKNILITGRHEEKRDVNQVGPGQYLVSSTLGGPKFSMGAGEKGTKLNKDSLLNPPPGSYDVNSSAGKHNSPGIVFGRDKRDHSKLDNMPGPGNYTVPTTLNEKGITIKGKYIDHPKERAPGPGAYDAKMDPSKVKGGSITFGHGEKSTIPKDTQNPGPGMYKVEAPYTGGHTFGKDIRDKQKKSEEPGPGQYNWRKEEGLTYF